MHIQGGAREEQHPQDADKPQGHGEHDHARPDPASEKRHLQQVYQHCGQDQAQCQLPERLIHAPVFTFQVQVHPLGHPEIFQPALDVPGHRGDIAPLGVDQHIRHPTQTRMIHLHRTRFAPGGHNRSQVHGAWLSRALDRQRQHIFHPAIHILGVLHPHEILVARLGIDPEIAMNRYA